MLMLLCFLSLVWRLHGLLSALEGISRSQPNRAAQAGFPLSRVMPGSACIKTSPGVLFSGEMPGEGPVS